MKTKQGISLIVLVITIIVMIILAAAVIITISNTNIVDRAQDAVGSMNLKQVQEIAQTIYAEGLLEKEDAATIKEKIIAAIGSANASKYDINVTENGVTVEEIVPLTPSERYYGVANVVPTNAEYFTYDDYDTENMTVTLTGVHEDYAQVEYYTWGSNSEPYTTAIVVDGTVITDVVIPYEMVDENGDTYTITAIGDVAFSIGYSEKSTEYTSFILPNTITSIGSGAFAYCDSFTSITIPDSVTSIGYGAFAYCESLRSITIPDGVTSIGGSTFKGCSSLESVTIPDSVANIEYQAFYLCGNLANVYYKGSETDWATITISDCNTELTSANITYNYTGTAQVQ